MNPKTDEIIASLQVQGTLLSAPGESSSETVSVSSTFFSGPPDGWTPALEALQQRLGRRLHIAAEQIEFSAPDADSELTDTIHITAPQTSRRLSEAIQTEALKAGVLKSFARSEVGDGQETKDIDVPTVPKGARPRSTEGKRIG